MVASLQTKKEILENKLKDKTSELRKLCLEEAELTGVLPPETPLEPGESPPQFRRRIATAYTFPENLINKLKSKEDETLAALELECKIQTGIAEAALGLSNDGNASKSVRRKHRVLYEETQNRLHELESRLSTLRQQTQPKHKKKPRPQTEIEDTTDKDEIDNVTENLRQNCITDRNGHISVRHSHTYCGYPKYDEHLMPYHQRFVNNHGPIVDHRHGIMVTETTSNNPSPIDNACWWSKNREMWHYQVNNQQITSPDQYYVENGHNYDRFGSLDRNNQSFITEPMLDNRLSSTLPRNIVTTNQTNSTILLPGQTYPESSLMRTQSLGSVESSNKSLVLPSDRDDHSEIINYNEKKKYMMGEKGDGSIRFIKTREKEWYESNLDSTPMTVPSTKISTNLKNPETSSLKSDDISAKISADSTSIEHETNQASINNIQFDTVVPYESPKNHTVVQAGKWQPYREVTKPFEMSDFYKYSTKFRQFKIQVQSDPKTINEQQRNSQHKGVYKPLQPLECRPLITSDGRNNKNMVPNGCVLTYGPYSSTWYHEKNNVHGKQPRPSTLV